MYLIDSCIGDERATGCILDGRPSRSRKEVILPDQSHGWEYYRVDLEWVYEIIPSEGPYRVYKLEVLNVSD